MNLELIADWKSENWRGFKSLNGIVDGRECRIVLPDMGLRDDRRWAWRAEFFGAFSNADEELVRRGYALAYMNVQNMYGSPVAMGHFDAFYEFSRRLGLNRRVALIGLSRGGLFIYNWAACNTDKIACLYADAPVCDIRSWPCGKLQAAKYPEDCKRCLAMYGFTPEDLESKYVSPIEKAAAIAKAGIPIIHVCGDADDVVPIAENSIPLVKAYIEAGGLDCRLVVKPGCCHHPHGLENPEKIVEFIEHCF